MKFSKAPADASKVSFEVSNGTVPVTVSVSWNDAATEATLTKSSVFITGDYTVKVVNDGKDLGTSNVTISEQKVAKIEITSSKLGVVSNVVAGETVQTGYATYRILDQYGVDITNLALGQNVQFQTGVGDIEASKGLLKITPSSGLNLLTFSGGVVITANDTTSGVSTTATLATSSQIGTLSDITLTTLTNADNKELTAGDSTTVFYLGYTATDLSGNPTTNYELIKQGLIFQGDTTKLTSSNPNVTAEVVQDPKDSSKAVIKVVASDEMIQVDMPLTITAMTWTGKTSQFNTTLKKQAEVATFTLYAPSEAIASGESKEIPFTAYDQNGKQVTKYSELYPKVTLTGADFVRNVDGTASVKNRPVINNSNTSVPTVISASVPRTGKYSSITINIQKPVKADTLVFNSSVVKTNLQAGGASQKADFGWDKGGFTVKDQYGREIDMTTAAASDYKIKVTSDNPSIISATVNNPDPNGNLTTGNSQIVFTSVSAGSTTVRFELLNGENKVLDTKSLTFSSVKDSDIKDYAIDQLSKPAYGGAEKKASITAYSSQELGYNVSPKVYGKTGSGALVVLKGSPIIGANSTSADFVVYGVSSGSPVAYSGGAYDSIKVLATKPNDPAKTEAKGSIIATVRGADGYIYTVSTPIESSTAKPAAQSVDVSVSTEKPGIERDGDVITLTEATGRTYAGLLGDTLAKYKADGTKGTQNVYFAPKDQYGKTDAPMAQYALIAPESSTVNGSVINLASNGTITGSTFVTGDYITVSATTTTGLVKTIRINFGAQVVAPTPEVTAALASINAGTGTVANYVTLGYPQVTAANLSAVNAAVSAAKASKGSDLTRSEIGTAVASVVAADAAAIALAAVNNATTAAGMKTALENPNLGLSAASLAAYNTFAPAGKTAVAQYVLDGIVGAGYANITDLQTRFNNAPSMGKTMTAQAATLEVNAYNALPLTTVGEVNAAVTNAGIAATTAIAAAVAAGNTDTWTAIVTAKTAAVNVEKAKITALTDAIDAAQIALNGLTVDDSATPAAGTITTSNKTAFQTVLNNATTAAVAPATTIASIVTMTATVTAGPTLN